MKFIELIEASREYSIDVNEVKKVATYFFGDNLEKEYNQAVTYFSERIVKAESLSELEYECKALIKRAHLIFKGPIK